MPMENASLLQKIQTTASSLNEPLGTQITAPTVISANATVSSCT